MLIDRDRVFFSLDEVMDDCGNNPLLLSIGCEPEHLAGKLGLLLDCGASSNAKNHHGNTVLHLMFERFGHLVYQCHAIRFHRPDISYLREALSVMIQAGGDIRAQNNLGYTVSDYAYIWQLGSIWEDSLTACGHNASEICGDQFGIYGNVERQTGRVISDGELQSCSYSDCYPGHMSVIVLEDGQYETCRCCHQMNFRTKGDVEKGGGVGYRVESQTPSEAIAAVERLFHISHDRELLFGYDY